MRTYINNCVGCPTEMGCLGNSCPYLNVPMDICDVCGKEAGYRIDDYDMCETCAAEYLEGLFRDLSVSEMAELLDVEVVDLDDCFD